jgi:hypothetical protein
MPRPLRADLRMRLKLAKQTRLNACLQFLGLLLEVSLSLACLLHDIIELVALRLKVCLTLGERSLCLVEVSLTLSTFWLASLIFLLAELNLECLELNLLGQRIVLSVVASLSSCCLVAVYTLLVLLNLITLLSHSSAEVSNLSVDVSPYVC